MRKRRPVAADERDHVHVAKQARPFVIVRRELHPQGAVRNEICGTGGLIDQQGNSHPHHQPHAREIAGRGPDHDDPHRHGSCRGIEPYPAATEAGPGAIRQVADHGVRDPVPEACGRQQDAHGGGRDEEDVGGVLHEIDAEHDTHQREGDP